MPMTQIWENDKVIAVTPVLAGPCVITQVKTQKIDNYSALQLAFGKRKSKNLKKPQQVKYAKAGVSPMHVREFRLQADLEANIGDQIKADTFTAGDIVQVTGTSKGRGFQGVVKRYGFKGGRKSHGNKDQLRMPGSVGAKGPAHIFKGMRMGGRMGNERVSVQNLRIASVDLENDIIYIQGALPGAIDSLLYIKGEGDLIIKSVSQSEAEVVEIEEVPAEQEIKTEEIIDVEEIVEKKAEEETAEVVETISKEETKEELGEKESPKTV